MSDLEISKALALAIGWVHVEESCETHGPQIYVRETNTYAPWNIFDYRNWNVISPIAERYDCFPYRNYEEQWATGWGDAVADTPQKAIALAVIEGAKK